MPDEVERQYHQEYDLSSEESEANSNLSSRSPYIFKGVEKFDFQAMLNRKKKHDAKKAQSKISSTSKTVLNKIGKIVRMFLSLFQY